MAPHGEVHRAGPRNMGCAIATPLSKTIVLPHRELNSALPLTIEANGFIIY